MTDQDFERKEKARQDAMFDAQFADEPTSDVDYADEPQVNGWPLYSGLPQPLQEPVAWGILNTRPTEKQPLMMVMLDEPEPSHLVVPLYTAPPQRKWQGLTDKEYETMAEHYVTNCYFDTLKYARAIEAKLKEKNT